MVDVVYTLSTGSTHGDWELRYSLRSLEMFAIGLGRVFVIGHNPEWLTGVTHMAHEAPHSNKDADIIHKLRLACNSGVTERFIKASDDQCLLRKIDLRTLPAHYRKRLPTTTPWLKRLGNTIAYLREHGQSTKNFDTHTFQPHCRSEFLAATESAPYDIGQGLTVNTLVLNQSPSVPKHRLGKRRLRIHRQNLSRQALRKAFARHALLGYTDHGMTAAFMAEIETLFPTPSQFEKP